MSRAARVTTPTALVAFAVATAIVAAQQTRPRPC
jgi:hypothetical protein